MPPITMSWCNVHGYAHGSVEVHEDDVQFWTDAAKLMLQVGFDVTWRSERNQ